MAKCEQRNKNPLKFYKMEKEKKEGVVGWFEKERNEERKKNSFVGLNKEYKQGYTYKTMDNKGGGGWVWREEG